MGQQTASRCYATGDLSQVQEGVANMKTKEYAEKILTYGLEIVPPGHFVIAIVDDGSRVGSGGKMYLCTNANLNPGWTIPDMLRTLANEFEKAQKPSHPGQ